MNSNFVNCEFYVAGTPFHKYQKVAEKISVGDLLVLEPEPTNKYDKNAVKILTTPTSAEPSSMLGYVAAKTGEALIVSQALKAGILLQTKVTFNDPEKTNKWRRLKVWIKEEEVDLEDYNESGK